MKALTIILLLQVQCFTQCSSQDQQKDYHNAETALYLWNRMKEVLLYLKEFSRPLFMDKCFEVEDLCPTTAFNNDSSLQWDGSPSRTAKAYFWQTYKCAKEKKVELCPVDGEWGAWTKWSICSGECGTDGNMTRTRRCNNPIPNKNGFPCEGLDSQSKACRTPCKRKHKISIKEAESYLHKINSAYPELMYDCMEQHCTFEQIGETLDPNTKNKYWSSLQCVKYNGACPIDGGWSAWNAWSACHPDCGVGTTFRFKTCTDPAPANSGLPCVGDSVEEKSCFGVGCSKEDFIYGRYVSDWSPYGSCSEECDKYGEQVRKRICLQKGKCSAEFGDNDEIKMSKPCYNGPCPIDGGWSKWSEFTQCSADCGAGRMTRVRLCNEPEPVGSASCLGYPISTKNCRGKCNVAINTKQSAGGEKWDDVKKGYKELAKLQDAVPSGDPYEYSFNPKLEKNYTPWSIWTKCSKACDVGYRKRQRTCIDKTKICLGEVRQLQYCNTISCPVNGGWSDWMSWSPCTTTCGDGQHFRYRKCDNPLPVQGGSCVGVNEEAKDCNLRSCSGINVGFGQWGEWELCSKSCGLGERIRTRSCDVQTMDPQVKKMFDGMTTKDICTEKRTKETSTCNPKPCPVDGQWSSWNSWSDCSENCGTGFHYRDRTCTNPAPANGGDLCQGPGSETIACFNGPCPDQNHNGILFTGHSWLKYEPRHKPTRFLAVYVKFFPEAHKGVLLHRYKTCPKCNHHVKLYLEKGMATLLIRHNDAVLKIQPKQKLKEKQWHTVLVLVSGNVGFIRINDGLHHYNGYSTPVEAVSYDATMIVGADNTKKNGFKGTIAYLKVNFKELSLFDVPGWIGYGVPFDKRRAQSQFLDPVIDFPMFYGNSYMKLEITEDKKLSVKVSFWLKSLSGILLFNMGSTPGSYFFVNFVNGGLHFCFKCTEAKKVCQKIAALEVHKWYVISVYINENLAKIRLNSGMEYEMTSGGMTYRPSSPLFVGGGESKDNIMFKMLTGHKKGFGGVIDNIVLNGESHKLKNKAIMNNKGFISSVGISHIPMVTQIYEHTVSIVTLRCDYTQYFKNSKTYVTVAWFQGDSHIKSGSDQKIIPRLPGIHNVSAIVLSPSSHQNGIYACGIKTGGLITVTHAFVLLRTPSAGVQTSDVEVWIFRVVVLATPVILAIFMIIICWQVIKRRKRDKFMEIAGKVQEELKEEFKTREFLDDQDIGEKQVLEETEPMTTTEEKEIEIDLTMGGVTDAGEETEKLISEKESEDEEGKGDTSKEQEKEETDIQDIPEEVEGDKIEETGSKKDLLGTQSMKITPSFDDQKEQLLRSSVVSFPPDTQGSIRSMTSAQLQQIGSKQRSMTIRPSQMSNEDVFRSPSDRLSKQQSINLEAQISMAPLPAGSPSPPRNLPSVQSTPERLLHMESQKSFFGSRGSVAVEQRASAPAAFGSMSSLGSRRSVTVEKQASMSSPKPSSTMMHPSMTMPQQSSGMFPPQIPSSGPSMTSSPKLSATSVTYPPPEPPGGPSMTSSPKMSATSAIYPPRVPSGGPSMIAPPNMSATSFTRGSSISMHRQPSYPVQPPSSDVGDAPLQSIYTSRSSLAASPKHSLVSVKSGLGESSTSVPQVPDPLQPPDVDDPVALSKSNLSSRGSITSERRTIPLTPSSSVNARSNASSIRPPTMPPSQSSLVSARSNASSIRPPCFPPPPIPMMTSSVNNEVNDETGIQSSKSGASSIKDDILPMPPSDASETSDMPPSPPGPPPTPPAPM